MKRPYFIPAIAIAIALMLSACGSKETDSEVSSQAPKGLNITLTSLAKPNDPVCGMDLKEGVGDTLSYHGKRYGFCGDECRDKFKNDPEHYLKGK